MIQFFAKRLKSNKGFTLVELIVVIAILGILGAIAVPRISGITEIAQKQADISNAKLIANMIYAALAEGRINFSANGNRIVDGSYNIVNTYPDVHNVTKYQSIHGLAHLLITEAGYLKGIGVSELTGGDFLVRVRNRNIEIYVGGINVNNMVYPIVGENWK